MPNLASITNVRVDTFEMMYYVCFCVMCSGLNLYNELKFQHLQKTSNVVLNKRIMWGHNKSNRYLYVLSNRKTNTVSVSRVSKDRRIAVGVRILHDRKFKWRNNESLFEQMNALKLKIEFDLDSSVSSRQVGWRQTQSLRLKASKRTCLIATRLYVLAVFPNRMERQIWTAFSAEETVDTFFQRVPSTGVKMANFDFVTPFVCVFLALDGLQLRKHPVSLSCPINMDNCKKKWYTELYIFHEQG
jgi:hypothetical protein